MSGTGKNKIAIVTGTLCMGGAELIILSLGRNLRHLGYDVTVVTTSVPGVWFDQIEKNGLNALRIEGRERRHPYRHAWHVGRKLKAENFDAVILVKYTNSERFTQAALNMLPDRVIAIPWIHGDTESLYRAALVNRASWNVAVGVGVRVAETAARKSRGRPVLYIPNGLEPLPAGVLPDGRSADTRSFRLCYVGRLQQDHKNIFSLPVILKQCVQQKLDVVLDLVGDGPERAELMQRFAQAGVLDRVVGHGAVSNHQVLQILGRAHILLMPSHSEAMPCAPIEAQFCGCVPVVSNLPGVTDTILDDGRTGILVGVDDINGFVEAIGGLIRDPARWQAMSTAGPSRVAEFTADTMGRSFDELIQACLRGEYPLPHPRRAWLPVNPSAFHWKEAIPRQIHRLGLGSRLRGWIKRERIER
jgi:glycosyltransferase involved in cell wall biosynthesis